MKVISKKSNLSGKITVPGSKSHTIRALLLASMADGVSHISNPLPSNDCLSTVQAVRQIGGNVTINEDMWTVDGCGNKLHLPTDKIDVGNSGSLMYFLCPILSTLSGECIFTGDSSICKRPVGHLIDALIQLGAKANCINSENTPPFSFCGPIDVQKTLTTEGALSQYISGFMMAATKLNGTLHIKLNNPKETPYLTMTQMWLKSLGVDCRISDDFKDISVTGPVNIKGFDKDVPADWEGIAFPLIAALMSDSKIVIENVDGSGSQGDEKIVEILQSVGADIVWDKNACTLTVTGGKKLSTKALPGGVLNIKISDFPDAICALSVIACFIEGKTVISDIEICRKKETDRIWAMSKALEQMGFTMGTDLIVNDETMTICGSSDNYAKLKGGVFESYDDHRIAMALACYGLGLTNGQEVTVKNAECCSVSFPHFYETMNKIGAGFAITE